MAANPNFFICNKTKKEDKGRHLLISHKGLGAAERLKRIPVILRGNEGKLMARPPLPVLYDGWQQKEGWRIWKFKFLLFQVRAKFVLTGDNLNTAEQLVSKLRRRIRASACVHAGHYLEKPNVRVCMMKAVIFPFSEFSPLTAFDFMHMQPASEGISEDSGRTTDTSHSLTSSAKLFLTEKERWTQNTSAVCVKNCTKML